LIPTGIGPDFETFGRISTSSRRSVGRRSKTFGNRTQAPSPRSEWWRPGFRWIRFVLSTEFDPKSADRPCPRLGRGSASRRMVLADRYLGRCFFADRLFDARREFYRPRFVGPVAHYHYPAPIWTRSPPFSQGGDTGYAHRTGFTRYYVDLPSSSRGGDRPSSTSHL